MDRIQALYERDKNCTCVVCWSMGNESLGGETPKKMYRYLKNVDDTRFVHFECHGDPEEQSLSDVQSKMYARPQECEEYALTRRDGRPYLLCEYTHAMGNSCGSTDEYTTLWDKYPCLQGGFVWDWVDQSILTKDDQGRGIPARGELGDWSPTRPFLRQRGCCSVIGGLPPSITKFKSCINMWTSVPWTRCGAKWRSKINTCLRILADFELYWCQCSDKGVFRDGVVEVQLAPGEKKVLDLELGRPCNTEFYLNLELRTKEKTLWCPAGFAVAKEQFVIAPLLTHTMNWWRTHRCWWTIPTALCG